VKDARRKVQKVWETEYKLATTLLNTPSTLNIFLSDLYDSDENEFVQYNKYDTYCTSPPINVVDALH